MRLSVAALNKQWTVFSDVTAPASFSAVPTVLAGAEGAPVTPAHACLERGVIDVAKLNGGRFRSRARALLFNEFTSPAPGVMEAGFSARGRMAVHINGKEIVNTLEARSVSGKFTPNDHVVELPVQEGSNLLAVVVVSGANGWGGVGNVVKQDSSLADAAGYWRSANSTRLTGRPFIVSEFNHCFWNPYQHECGLVFGAYSALQGFSALEIHSGPVTLEVGTPKVDWENEGHGDSQTREHQRSGERSVPE